MIQWNPPQGDGESEERLSTMNRWTQGVIRART